MVQLRESKFLVDVVHREGAGFDAEVAASREAEHVLTLGVPGHTVGV